MSLNYIPNEIILEICRYLEFPDLIRFARSQTRIYKISTKLFNDKRLKYLGDSLIGIWKLGYYNYGDKFTENVYVKLIDKKIEIWNKIIDFNKDGIPDLISNLKRLRNLGCVLIKPEDIWGSPHSKHSEIFEFKLYDCGKPLGDCQLLFET